MLVSNHSEVFMKEDFYQMRLDGIQTLRGFAAVLVVLEHIRFLACGAFGVDIFFCISGFMIMFTTHNSTEHFFRKRLLRIVPFYHLMTLGSFGLLVLFPSMFEQTRASFSSLIKSLLFVPFDMGGGVLQPLLRIGWTVNCEMFFYLLFWIAFHISHKYRGLICSLLLLACVAIGAIVSGGNTWTGESLPAAHLPGFLASHLPGLQTAAEAAETVISPWLAPLLLYGNPVMLEFILGIVCYHVSKGLYTFLSKHPSPRPKLTGSILLLCAAILILGLIRSTSQINILGYRRVLYWGIPAMLLVLCFFTAGLFLKMPALSVRLGDISFSLYLIHYYPIMFLDRKVFDFSTLRAQSVIGAAAGTALVILLAYISWYLIEKKFTGWLRRKLCSSY